jgi:hypothetical protein
MSALVKHIMIKKTSPGIRSYWLSWLLRVVERIFWCLWTKRLCRKFHDPLHRIILLRLFDTTDMADGFALLKYSRRCPSTRRSEFTRWCGRYQGVCTYTLMLLISLLKLKMIF